MLASLKAAIREQKLGALADQLRSVVPDLSAQYSAVTLEGEYWETKLRGLHAFQVSLLMRALEMSGRGTVVDIGDSSGTHPKYLKALTDVRDILSVNLDPIAVKKIRANGENAILSRAEDLRLAKPVVLAYALETLEHLTDPLRFLHQLAVSGQIKCLAFTVPFRRVSRFGGDALRRNGNGRLTAEDVHVLELSPDDWALLARFSGWRTVETRTYRQYPRFGPLRVTQPLWARGDFEGFFGAICLRDEELSSRYTDW